MTQNCVGCRVNLEMGNVQGVWLNGFNTHTHTHTSPELQLPRALKSRCLGVIEGPAGRPALLIPFPFMRKTNSSSSSPTLEWLIHTHTHTHIVITVRHSHASVRSCGDHRRACVHKHTHTCISLMDAHCNHSANDLLELWVKPRGREHKVEREIQLNIAANLVLQLFFVWATIMTLICRIYWGN